VRGARQRHAEVVASVWKRQGDHFAGSLRASVDCPQCSGSWSAPFCSR